MNAQNTATAPKPQPLPLLSETQESLIKDAFRTLLAAVGQYGSTTLPTDISETSVDQWEILAVRAIKGTRVLVKARREAALADIKQGVKAACEPHIAASKKARAEYDTLSPELRRMLPAFPDHISVPMSDFSASFPQGTKLETMVVVIKELGYTVSKGKDNTYAVRVQTPFSSGNAKSA